MAGEKVARQDSAGRGGDGYSPQHACCLSPDLIWAATGLVEPIITCIHCGFRIDPDGLLLDWLDPEEIQAARMIEENTPYILELAARLGLISKREEERSQDE